MVLHKGQLEVQLKDEHQLIRDGVLKDDSPLDISEAFENLCIACRVGDLKGCQEAIVTGVNINARDAFDNTPLILASLCGHFEVVQLLLESGALCERDTFQGERCLYNALNIRIRNLLLQYDYSKSADPLQPLASHITSLLTRTTPTTSDICLTTSKEHWNMHKFVLSARSPYFSQKLAANPEITTWKLPNTIPSEAFQVALRYIYFADISSDFGISNTSAVTEEELFKGIDKISKQLETESLWQSILSGNDRRIRRQHHQDEVAKGRDQLEAWYRGNVLKHKVHMATKKSMDVKWTRDNSIFADVLLRADEEVQDEATSGQNTPVQGTLNGIPLGPNSTSQPSIGASKPRQSVLYPCHRAMLSRSEYFDTMFASPFREAQTNKYLNIVTLDCTPAVLEIVLTYLYTEKAEIPIELALDVLFLADMLFIEKLKTKAAIVISTVGMGRGSLTDRTHLPAENEPEVEVELINVYDVIKAAWYLKIQRLEEFSARYLAYRLENYIDEDEFAELIKESASRVENRQATDTIELLDDIRYHLSERFRNRFADTGLAEITDETPTDNWAPGKSMPTKWPNGNPLAPKKSKQIRALNGELVEDEFEADAINYEVLIGKVDELLDYLKLDA